MVDGDGPKIDQVLMLGKEEREKTKMGSRRRYNL
jgi:hypothetical protein